MRAWLALIAALALAACASRPADEPELPEDLPLQAVGHVDLDRYMGRWYLIANIPYFAERGNLAAYVEYRRREDGRIDDYYTARDAFDHPPFTKHGQIIVLDPKDNSAGQISFLEPLWLDYSIVFLDADYRYTAIAHPSRNYAWIFSRTPRMPDEVYRRAIDALAANGFDVARVLKMPQFPAQVGQPGFQ
ncbi:MAG TPA: lipocalin family protein [Solimonas sp.]|nr:lipocalin family protein [Solimonas sp.]